MSVRADYHMHSHHSGDSQEAMDAMVAAAKAKGLTHMCITEHMDLEYPDTPDTPAGSFELNIKPYKEELFACREKYAKDITLGFGIEVGMQPHLTKENTQIVLSENFDFVIASSHLVMGLDPCFHEMPGGMTDEEMYRKYFEEELACIKAFENFDVYGHIDYVVRYGKEKDRNYSYDRYKELFEEMITVLLDKGKGIELNTAGIRKGLRNMHPCPEFLKRYRERGGEIITVGSDAHVAGDIGANFDLAAGMLSSCGFTHYCTFKNRVPQFHKL